MPIVEINCPHHKYVKLRLRKTANIEGLLAAILIGDLFAAAQDFKTAHVGVELQLHALPAHLLCHKLPDIAVSAAGIHGFQQIRIPLHQLP